MQAVIDRLLASDEPSIRFEVHVGVLGEDPGSPALRALRCEIQSSPRVRALLAERDEQGRVRPVGQPYRKWAGAHWVFAALADLGYPAGDVSLMPVRDQVLDHWLRPEAIEERTCDEAPPTRVFGGVPVIRGRARRCASQQGNALFAAVRLGLLDERCHRLARLLLRWQWPDGGWNCDRRPEAATSSFWESLIPLRGLAAYAQATGDEEVKRAAARAAEVFLARRLYRRARDGEVMQEEFVRLHYPRYWRYDVLFGLKVMAEAGFVGDLRCAGALDVLQSKSLPDGGWPAEGRFYQTARPASSGYDRVAWGGVSRRRLNEWVTADALVVLHRAGRLDATAEPRPVASGRATSERGGHDERPAR